MVSTILGAVGFLIAVALVFALWKLIEGFYDYD